MANTSKQTGLVKQTDYKKSNILISSMSKGGLLENQLNAIGLQKIYSGQYYEDKETKSQVVRLRAAEIRKLLNTNSGSFYTKLANVAAAATGRIIGIVDPEKGFFDFLPINSRMTYAEGTLEIRYNSELKSYLSNLKNNFTVLNLDTMLSFKSLYTFRLYELLKSKAFYQKYESHNNRIHIYYSVSELKLRLGIIDVENPIIKKELDKSSAPDYDRIVLLYENDQREQADAAVRIMQERLKDNKLSQKEKQRLINIEKQKYFPSYSEWRVFKSELLEPTLAEIKEIASDIDVMYDVRKAGRGGKVVGIDFYVAIPQTTSDNISTLSEDEKLDLLDDIRDIIHYPLKTRDVKAIAEVANYDIVKIQQAADVLNNTDNVDNPVGFMIKAIEDGYVTREDNVIDAKYTEVMDKVQNPKAKKRKSKNKFNDFEHHQYNIEEIERNLLSN